MTYNENMTKKAKSFRLSPQAQENLVYLTGVTGSSETAILEISLAYFRKVMGSGEGELKPVPTPEVISVGPIDMKPDWDNPPKAVIRPGSIEQPKPKRKRKRKH